MKLWLALVLLLPTLALAAGAGKVRSGPGFSITMQQGWSDLDGIAGKLADQAASTAPVKPRAQGGIASGDPTRGVMALVLWMDFDAAKDKPQRQLDGYHDGLKAQLAKGGVKVDSYTVKVEAGGSWGEFTGSRGGLSVRGRSLARIEGGVLHGLVAVCVADEARSKGSSAACVDTIASFARKP